VADKARKEHAASAVREQNRKAVNLLRPIMALVLAGFLIPRLVKALAQ
jgi:hypothetical protein